MQSTTVSTSSSTILVSLIDAARYYRPTYAQYKSALDAVPEPAERKSLQQYRPPQGVGLHEHYNPKSSLIARHLLRALLVRCCDSINSNNKAAVLPSSSSSSSSSSSTTDSSSCGGANCCPLTSALPPIPRCACCDRHIVQLHRTFEKRPCVVSSFCSCPSSSSCGGGGGGDECSGTSNNSYDQHKQATTTTAHHHHRPPLHPFIESHPSINLSHNNGVAFAGVLPRMDVGFFDDDDDDDNSTNDVSGSSSSSSSSSSSGVVMGVDVMCIDMVPTAMYEGLEKRFSSELIEEFMDLMESYMAPQEWVWINHEKKTLRGKERQKIFAQEFCQQFEERRRACGFVSSNASSSDDVGDNDHDEDDDDDDGDINNKKLKRREQQQQQQNTTSAAAGQGKEKEGEETIARRMCANPKFVHNLYRFWRFLILWTVKEAILKASGIGLGIEPDHISVVFSSSSSSSSGDCSSADQKKSEEGEEWDIDAVGFYSATLNHNTPASSDVHPPLSHIHITVQVPDMLQPNGVVGPAFFNTWLVFDKASMSTAAVVCAPAWTSRWSGHANYVFRRNQQKHQGSSSSSNAAADDVDNGDDAWIAMVRKRQEEKWQMMQQQQKVQSASSSKFNNSLGLRVLQLDLSLLPNSSVVGGDNCSCRHVNVLFGQNKSNCHDVVEEGKAANPCCGCCLSRVLR